MGIFDRFKKAVKGKPAEDKVTVNISEPTITTSDEDSITPISEYIKTAIPSSNGLYPHEILLLHSAPSYYIGDNKYQGFWWCKYGIENVGTILDSLMDRAYVQQGDLKEALEKETVKSLPSALSTFNLFVSGKKADLIQRLLDEAPIDKLEAVFTKRTYALTELGQGELEKESYIVYIHNNNYGYLNIWSLNKLMYDGKRRPYRDSIWSYLSDKSMEKFNAKSFHE